MAVRQLLYVLVSLAMLTGVGCCAWCDRWCPHNNGNTCCSPTVAAPVPVATYPAPAYGQQMNCVCTPR